MQKEILPCQLDKMWTGSLCSLDEAKIKNIGNNIASTITARYYKGVGANGDNMVLEKDVKRIGNLYEENGYDSQLGRIYDENGISPTLDTCKGGSRPPKIIVAMRGRNPSNPSDRTVGAEIEQRLEPNSQGICNTITSVQKDNLVLETVKIKQATKEGYIECEVGGVADLSFPDSETRRGRVQEGGEVCPTLTAMGSQEIHKIESRYRIRKLTPLECWRLMDFDDEDFRKAESVNSNSQLYKQAGNSIVREVLVGIFKQLNIDN